MGAEGRLRARGHEPSSNHALRHPTSTPAANARASPGAPPARVASPRKPKAPRERAALPPKDPARARTSSLFFGPGCSFLTVMVLSISVTKAILPASHVRWLFRHQKLTLSITVGRGAGGLHLPPPRCSRRNSPLAMAKEKANRLLGAEGPILPLLGIGGLLPPLIWANAPTDRDWGALAPNAGPLVRYLMYRNCLF